MLPIIAVPVLHSSGAWIASTAASGYITGTLSSSWVGAFILGNSGILSSLGLVSAGGIFAASGGLTGLAATATATAGSVLTTIGLGGLAKSLGLAPATFLGLTPVGWAVAGTTAVGSMTLGYFMKRRVMKKINDERIAGGLEPTTVTGIFREIREFERAATLEILRKLSKERLNFKVHSSAQIVEIDGKNYSIPNVRYIVNEDGSEELIFVGKLGRKKRIFLVKGPSTGGDSNLTPQPS